MADKPVTRVGINGLGRIGRMALRRYFAQIDDDKNRSIEIVAANDLAPLDALAYLFKYDSVHGRFHGSISHCGDELFVNGHAISFSSQRNPEEIPWRDLGVDVVLECTGRFKTHEELEKHLSAGAKKVILSAPSSDTDITVVIGVNDLKYDPVKHHIISNASCTTNSLAPVAKVLSDEFGIDHMFATTVHAYTSSQSLIDTPVAKKSRGRSAAVSIIPSSTGAAEATSLVLPELKGKVDAVALRVPIPDGAVTEIVANLSSVATVDELNTTIKEACESDRMNGILGWTSDDIVSVDIIGDSRSSIVNLRSTKVLGRNMVYMQAWYDNEWGYSCRLIELASMVASFIQKEEPVTISFV